MKDEIINALIKEIGLSSYFLLNDKSETEIIDTIYFGGGTPSLLLKDDIKNLLAAIHDHFIINENAEITLEANPDDINKENLLQWKQNGINRLSIGIQSLEEKDLRGMNRAHNTEQAIQSVELARDAGFQNFSIDLIYGTPELTNEEWKRNVDFAIKNNIPHIACYALTVEPNTALQKMISLKKKKNIDSDQQANQFQLLIKWLKEAGYEHYEISNFTKHGYRSKHNSSYWQGKKYVGIGPSAHSYNGTHRKWNIANNALYIEALKKNKIPFEEEKLSINNKLNEYIMVSLRTMEGIDLKIIENNFSKEERQRLENAAVDYINKKKIVIKEENIMLTDEGKLFADGIAASLFNA